MIENINVEFEMGAESKNPFSFLNIKKKSKIQILININTDSVLNAIAVYVWLTLHNRSIIY